MDIAKQFVTRVGGKLDRIKAGEKDKKALETSELTMIPDGQVLFFVPKIEKYRFDSDIAGIKDKDTIYLQLEDFINVFNLSLDYDPERQRALGWFLREDWPLSIDVKQKTVFFRDKQFTIRDSDVLISDGQVYIDNKAMGTWLDIGFDLDVAQQYIVVDTPYPLPSIAKLEREKRKSLRSASNVTQLPRKEIEYDWLDINTMDVSGRLRFRQRENNSSTTDNSSVAMEGQLLKHQAYGLVTGNTGEGVDNVTARLSKKTEDPVLLGPLKARSYVLGDTEAVSIPLTGSSSQALGFRVSNNTLGSLDFQSTDITGDAIPGWDVELYRNGGRIETVRVGDDGRYQFPDTQLYAGDNLFELFFYGPQGEIRSETLNVPVTADMLATQDNTYDVSVSFADTSIYNSFTEEEDDNINAEDNEDEGTPDIAARYSTFIDDTLVFGGLHSYQDDGDTKIYGAGGFTAIKGGAILDGNVAVDERMEAAAELGVQKNFGELDDEWRTAASVLVQTDKFGLADDESPNDIYRVNASLTKGFDPWIGTLGNMFLTGDHSKATDGSSTNAVNWTLSNQVGWLGLTNSVIYNTRQGGDETLVSEDQEEQLFDVISGRINHGDFFARAGVNYEVKPDTGPEEYFAQATYRSSPKLTTDLTASHVPEDAVSDARLAVTYIHDKFRASPYVDVNTDDEVEAGIAVNFSAIKPPSQTMPILTSRRLTGRGMVSSFVYHDKNGNEIYDSGDEPLPEVVVESLNIKRREPTDSKGYSLIRDLSESRATDIYVDTSTLPDPYMVSGFEGVSIFPSAGEIVELEFPIHMGGAIDGTVYVGEGGVGTKVTRANIQLLPIDGKQTRTIEAEAAEDGYYDLSPIPPGTYLMTVSNASARRAKAAAPAPGIVRITYEGNTMSGVDVSLEKGWANVPVTTQMVLSGVPAGAPMPVLKIRQGGKTELLSLLRQLAVAKAPDKLFNDLEPIAPVGDQEPQVSYYKVPGNNIQKTHQRCQQMVNQGVSCEMIVFVRQLENTKPFKTALK